MTEAGLRSLHNEAVEWLAEKDSEARWREEDQKAEELRIARAAKDAAVEANDIAKSANALAHKALTATKNAIINAIGSAAIVVAAIFVAILK